MDNYSHVSPSRARLIPFTFICCLGLVLFLISSTIILSLIPTYLSSRNQRSTLSLFSTPQNIILPLSSNDALPIGFIFNNEIQNSIQNQMQEVVTDDPSLRTNVATLNVLSVVGITPSRRKRRQSSSTIKQISVVYQLLFSRQCLIKSCETRILNLVRSKLLLLVINIDTTGSGSTSITSTNNPPTGSNPDQVIGDIDQISKYWGSIRPYVDNPPNHFGVTDTGLPDECQVEQAHILHRHANRYPLAQPVDGFNMDRFALKIRAIHAIPNSEFTGPLAFLNTWTSRLGSEDLAPSGPAAAFKSGVDFWNTYGRILFNASRNQTYYNETGQPKILLRTSSLSRMSKTLLHWADGFFGPNSTSKYSSLTLEARLGNNNTLAPNLACRNAVIRPTGTANLIELFDYVSTIYSNATKRFSNFTPLNVDLTADDAYAMQGLCVYEYGTFGSSDFCSLFTLNEWRGFEQLYDIFFYRAYSFGSPVGRALGIGYLEELIARLNKQFITVSHSSVNSTLDSSPETFPLNQSFYMDMSSDITIVSFLTALSLDYFHENVSFVYPVQNENRHFRTPYIVPFTARVITEKIGCASSSPISTNSTRTPSNYSPETATHKFIRIRLNNAILPLDTIRGGLCSIGRSDGLCPMENFLLSQQNASLIANYQFVCYDIYTVNAMNFNEDGTVTSS